MTRATPTAASWLVAAALVALATPAAAQPATPVIVTDRPSFTNSPKVVGARMVQIEAGPAGLRDRTHPGTATRPPPPNTLRRPGKRRAGEFPPE